MARDIAQTETTEAGARADAELHGARLGACRAADLVPEVQRRLAAGDAMAQLARRMIHRPRRKSREALCVIMVCGRRAAM
jgi:hypothetical protein